MSLADNHTSRPNFLLDKVIVNTPRTNCLMALGNVTYMVDSSADQNLSRRKLSLVSGKKGTRQNKNDEIGS